MRSRVAIIGKGHVGSAIQKGLQSSGYELKVVGKDPPKVREAGAWAEVIVLAVPYAALDDTLKELGDSIDGKTLVDASNALSPDFQLALGFSTSGAEELQKKTPRARVVKAFNTVFSGTMSDGKVKGQTLTLFVAGDDGGAKGKVLSLGRDIGFDAVDAGPLKNARWLEALGYLNIQLGFTQKMGAEIGFKLVH